VGNTGRYPHCSEGILCRVCRLTSFIGISDILSSFFFVILRFWAVD
jgi:hypothetical protein